MNSSAANAKKDSSFWSGLAQLRWRARNAAAKISGDWYPPSRLLQKTAPGQLQFLLRLAAAHVQAATVLAAPIDPQWQQSFETGFK
jgi:hypothetical protein